MTEKLPGIHVVEYLRHRELVRDGEGGSSAIDSRNRREIPRYVLDMQHTNALIALFGRRIFIRDARNEKGGPVTGSFVVMGVRRSEGEDGELFSLTLSSAGEEVNVFPARVYLGTYIMYNK